MSEPIIEFPGNTEGKLQALRESILGQEPEPKPEKEPLPLKPIERPLAIDRLTKVLKRKEVPYLLIYLTGDDKDRHANFETSIVHPQGAYICSQIIAANAAAFWPDTIEGITGQPEQKPAGQH